MRPWPPETPTYGPNPTPHRPKRMNTTAATPRRVARSRRGDVRLDAYKACLAPIESGYVGTLRARVSLNLRKHNTSLRLSRTASGIATLAELWNRRGDLRFSRFEAGLLDDLDGVGSARDAELDVDRRDVCLDGGAREVKTIGDILEREMRPQESDEPELGRCESVVLSLPDPRFEALQPGRQRSGIGISLECVARDLRVFEGAGNVAEVEADVGAAQREIGVEPWARAEQRAEPPDVLELACGLGLVTALVVRERSGRVARWRRKSCRGGAAGRSASPLRPPIVARLVDRQARWPRRPDSRA